jgi:hypothetical protein
MVLALLVLRQLDEVTVHVINGCKLTVVQADDWHVLLDLALVEHCCPPLKLVRWSSL